ncbi:MAG: hypothetical protein ABIP90_00265 [Vicinamibacterales bacterium]
MRNLPGWVVGALGVGAVAGAFFLGGRLAASDLTPGSAATVKSSQASALQVECEPGQRAVVRQSEMAMVNPGPATVSCVSGQPAPVGYTAAAYPVSQQYVTRPYVTRPYVSPAPRMVRTSSVTTVSRAPVSRNRSTRKSVAIIAGSTAAGAVIGGLTKGKKGALVGGLIGGGAATIWDQTTRRKGNR